MKTFLTFSILACFEWQGSQSFSSVSPKLATSRCSHTALDVGSALPEEWGQFRGPSFHNRQDQEESPTPSLADKDLALRSPTTGARQAKSEVGSSSYEGLCDFSKVGLAVAATIALGMVAASPEVDLNSILDLPQVSMSGDLSALMNDVTETFQHSIHSAQTGLMDVRNSMTVPQSLSELQDSLASFRDSLESSSQAYTASMVDLKDATLQSASGLTEAGKMAFMDVSQSAQDLSQTIMTRVDLSSASIALQDAFPRSEIASIAESTKTAWADATQNSQSWSHETLNRAEASLDSASMAIRNAISSSEVTSMTEASKAAWADASQNAQTWSQTILNRAQASMNAVSMAMESALPRWEMTVSRLSETQHQLVDDAQRASALYADSLVGFAERSSKMVDQIQDRFLDSAGSYTRDGMQTMQADWNDITDKLGELHRRLDSDTQQASAQYADAAKELLVGSSKIVETAQQAVLNSADKYTDTARAGVQNLHLDVVQTNLADTFGDAQRQLVDEAQRSSAHYSDVLGGFADKSAKFVGQNLQSNWNDASVHLDGVQSSLSDTLGEAQRQLGNGAQAASAHNSDALGGFVDKSTKVVGHMHEDLGHSSRVVQQAVVNSADTNTMKAGEQSMDSDWDSISLRLGSVGLLR